MESRAEESHHLFEELMRWWLWSDKKAVLSHATAAALYGLGGSLLPEKIHLSVPPSFRKRPAEGLILHKVKLRESEITVRDGLPVTKPLRTILDLAASRPDEARLEAVVGDAIIKDLRLRARCLPLWPLSQKESILQFKPDSNLRRAG